MAPKSIKKGDFCSFDPCQALQYDGGWRYYFLSRLVSRNLYLRALFECCSLISRNCTGPDLASADDGRDLSPRDLRQLFLAAGIPAQRHLHLCPSSGNWLDGRLAAS